MADGFNLLVKRVAIKSDRAGSETEGDAGSGCHDIGVRFWQGRDVVLLLFFFLHWF